MLMNSLVAHQKKSRPIDSIFSSPAAGELSEEWRPPEVCESFQLEPYIPFLL